MSNARKYFNLDVEEVTHDLREHFPPGSTAYTILRHVSRSGMSRTIDVVDVSGGDPLWLSPRVAVLLDYTWDDNRDALKVGGCGMDMGFHVVYGMSATLYGHAQDRRTKRMQPRVPLTEGEARKLAAWRRAERKRSPHHANTSGGYAVSQKWL